ncbi:MAG: adenosylcobinamide-phosphate synthase CbiB [Candidatus Thermoplasmatota archaeon]|jgi:adenosylcobinamide-phosphate synthase|nr:adenosylcobinamide-phosphate synthase CbiB [Candidatus Thermoplasmatota archaeon]MCL5954689.1 adenosylcobinamide-phosphate synthase CbiB [Candidatus Thermoplasmatota archaeon]
MSVLTLEISLAILLGSIAIDFLFGEPRKYVHPVTLIRKVGQTLDPYIRSISDKGAGGFLYVIVISAMFGGLIYALLYATYTFTIVYVIIAILLLKASFSLTSIGQDISPVVKALEEGRIEEARTFASRIIKRDTTGLSAPGISSAVIETISVSLLNDVFSPLFYFAFFGIAGAFISRVTNVLDTLVGQKNRRNIDFGKWPAIIHTVVNYIPAKIEALFIMMGTELLNYRVNSISFIAARTSTDSPNNGWAMGSMASSLNLRLEKSGYYIINENGFEPSVGDIKRALRAYYMSFYIYLIVFVIPVMIIVYFLPML